MKPFSAIVFSLLFLVQAFAPNGDLCCELQKIPALLSHYAEHKAYDGDSFYQFLAEDFFNEGHDLAGQHDTKEHEEMPFHGNHQCAHTPIYIPNDTSIELSEVSIEQPILYHPLHLQFCSEFVYSPFQPPKA
jgi:hypothetical protein